ncbi:hypothetical protein ACFQE5_18835 [Pseudonocardia hispaniensis]|uniref:Uncharacterized protein n=1 Tax=Pseudonocardia hispaniensis TaxID=904933 RepID=A0ABW1J765_9PSEU
MRGTEYPQVNGLSSDAGSSGFDGHGALFDLAATWGLGGALVELERLADEHEGLPRGAESLVRALSAFLADYAPTGSTREAMAWRGDPCTLCAGQVRLVEAGGDG